MFFRKRLFRWALVAVSVSVFLAGVGFVFWVVDPVGFRLFVFQPVRETRFFVRELEPFDNWNKVETTLLAKPKSVRLPSTGGDDLGIVGDVWAPTGGRSTPAVILLHGSAPWGRKAGLIQMLGRDLQQKGWFVIAPDARGFGDTDDPQNVQDPAAWAVSADIRRIVDFVIRADGVDPERIYLFGHSLGADHALEAGLADQRIRALILVGPSRYPQGVQVSSDLWNRVRFSADRKLEEPVNAAVMQAGIRRSDINVLADGPLGRSGHKPILLVDGEKEGSQKRAYLRTVVDGIVPPVQYRTLPGAGHYCGVVSFFGGSRVFYRPDIYHNLVELISSYIREQGSS